MKILNFDKELIHASGFSELTTEPKTNADKAAGILSVTTKTALKKIFIQEKYNRRKQINTKQMLKGTLQEEAAITLYCLLHKKMFVKNEVRFENEYITGEPDLIHEEKNGETKVTKGVDIKCSWDVFTFPLGDFKLPANYHWQNMCYMYLTGAVEWITAYCLVNATSKLIDDEKRKIYYMLDMPADDDPEYILQCLDIEKNMIFNMAEFKKENPNYDLTFDRTWLKDGVTMGYEWKYDIEMKDRVIEFVTVRDKFMIEEIPGYVTKARKYLNDLAIGKF